MTHHTPTQLAAARRGWLAADDAALISQCDVDTYRASGPGGQKRNKTSSAVRLRHRPSGLMVIAEESRSQHENKARALRRLRMAIALHVRAPIDEAWMIPPEFQQHITPAGRIELSSRNSTYPLAVAAILDVIDARRGRMSESAALVGVTTGQLSRFLGRDEKFLAAANQIRLRHGLRPIEKKGS